ncbi:MAG TPA: nucleoside-diphosphate kinase [Armatimonadota bacterium]|nr:nucleoside-diphosphate kinase [Armatimonadota bacterium]
MNDNHERTLVLLKPDAVQRGILGEVLSRFERKGLKLAGLKMVQLDDARLATHYSHLVGRPFYPRLAEFMKSTPIVAACWEGLDAVRVVRDHLVGGITNARNDAAGTIRGDFGMSTQSNLAHASESVAAANEEIPRFFEDDEIFDYDRALDDCIYAPDER